MSSNVILHDKQFTFYLNLYYNPRNQAHSIMPMSIERRKVVRYMTMIDIDLVLENDSILSVQTHDISLNGIQFKCDSFIANEIEPRGLQSYSLDRIKVKVITRFPTEDKQKFYASCKVITARRLSQEEYLLGLEFVDFEKNSEKILQNYIQKLALDELG